MATKLQKSLLAAVKRKDTKAVRQILAQGCDPDFCDSTGTTPLHEAIRAHHLVIVKALVAAGANVDRTVTDKERKGGLQLSPLDLAIRSGDGDIVKYLKTQKARTAKQIDNDEDRDEDGWPRWMSEKYDDEGSARLKKTAGKRKKTRDDEDDRPRFFWDDDGGADDDTLDEQGPVRSKGKTAAPRPPEHGATPDKPVFTADNLKEIFNAEKWTDKVEDMQKLWQQVPQKLKNKFDFAASLAEARRNTINKNAPAKKLGPPKPPDAPPQTPPV